MIQQDDWMKEKEKLFDFCKAHRNLFIYGAGNYGRGYFDILEANHLYVKGFVVTGKTKKEFCGKKVFCVEELEETEQSGIGIIPAYTNSDPGKIRQRFSKISPDILEMDHAVMLGMEEERRFYPIMDILDGEFGAAEKLPEHAGLNNILILRLDAIGDLVFTTPFIREIRRNYQESRISVVVRKQNQALLQDCPYIDKLYVYDSGLIGGELADQCRLYGEMRSRAEAFAKDHFREADFDAVFLPRQLLCGQNALEELLLAYLSGAGYRIGHILNNGFDKKCIYDRAVKSFSMLCLQEEPMHEVSYALDLLRKCGCTIADEKMELWPNAECRSYAQDILGKAGQKKTEYRIALGLVASADTRTWDVENYAALMEECEKKYGSKVRFLLLGGENAMQAAAFLHERFNTAVDLTGRIRLDQTAAIMEQCDLYVGSNTGLLHIASAFGIPSVTIYSELEDGLPTDGDSPCRMGAWMAPHIDLVPPAGLDGCFGVCRMEKSHCINLITSGQVMDAVAELLSGAKS